MIRLAAALALAAAVPAPAAAAPICICIECATGLFKSYRVSSESMLPGLPVGACVIRGAAPAPQPGEVVVVQAPYGDYIFRVVAVGGQTVAMRGGRLVLDGTPAPVADLGRPTLPPDSAAAMYGDGEPKLLRETLPNGASYEVLDTDPAGFLDEFGPLTVPDGHVFVLGDNRDNAADSRHDLGAVPLARVLGKVTRTKLP